MVVLTTNFGQIKIELFTEEAPITTANFIEYVKSGFYNGTIFHRVIPGFMVQGGGMLPGMEEKDGNATIKNEANNGLKNDRGTLAMARTMEPHSASSQFFINSVDNGFLNFRAESSEGWGYCVFAKVVEGMDIVDKISAVKTGRSGYHQDVPTEDVIIEKAEIEE
ncbi:peptidylprolyl isomerase [Psychrosphaera sp. B3R10]|uniref:peptidylprolyl isomerase n=1 Tax=unclassified Psychrosphaera TaxID=2641570 RepID=UPI001C086D9E|nr:MULTISPECIES: peptidylprolyl isomerase [unclassified Psychrosphaera]MBU2884101.1 peptidylprolyl isomerase [Psychrosphaera sp. I2R16]MBU2988231.1 peptidylprolyl isomerase [Psychrosphaera sp. B3R10]MDO6718440.1 peptidylprolyl isomerase [Psychrosphaera sp. 1_MG-2023]